MNETREEEELIKSNSKSKTINLKPFNFEISKLRSLAIPFTLSQPEPGKNRKCVSMVFEWPYNPVGSITARGHIFSYS